VPVLEQVLEKYPEEVKIVFKHFPLNNHKFAKKAATAALAAGSQGKFWEFHDLLFKNYNRLNDKKIRSIAIELSLDMVKFDKKTKDPLIQERISRDLRDGNRADVRGTPTVFINGKRLRDRTLPGFQKVIDRELQKQGRKAAKPAS
jgi:protein-disulfide isomerase